MSTYGRCLKETKKLGLVAAFLLGVLVPAVYGSIPNESPKFQVLTLLAGEHPLVPLGSYFITDDSVSDGKTASQNLIFLWLTDDGDYIVTSLPSRKVFVHALFRQKGAPPTVKFYWRNVPRQYTTPQELMDQIVIRAEITCSVEYLPYLFKSAAVDSFLDQE